MCSWGTRYATPSTSSCSIPNGMVIMNSTRRNLGATKEADRRNAARTERSSMLISGPIRANKVVTISPGITKANDANPPNDPQDAIGHQQADIGQGAQDLADRRSLVPPFDRAHQPLQETAVEGQSERRDQEDEGGAQRLGPQVVDRELGEQGAVGRIEAEDEEGRYEYPAGLGSGRAERHAPDVAGPDPGSVSGRGLSGGRIRGRVGGCGRGSGPVSGRGWSGSGRGLRRRSGSRPRPVRVGFGFGVIHAGRPPSPVNSKRRRSGSKAAGAPTS